MHFRLVGETRPARRPERAISPPHSLAIRSPGFGQNLLFVPGWTFFGGTYAAQIVQGEHYGPSTASINPPFAASADSRHRHQMLPAGGGVLRPRGAKLQ
jgi:hypothetical protein